MLIVDEVKYVSCNLVHVFFIILYQCGKCVPVIIPKHVRGIMAYLCNHSVRGAAGIPSSSIYIFATNSKFKTSSN